MLGDKKYIITTCLPDSLNKKVIKRKVMKNAKTGSFQIGGKDDGVTLNAQLLVVESDVVGVGFYKNVVSGVSFGVKFSGKVHATGLGTAHQLFALGGRPIRDIPGASNIPTLNITLKGIWGVEGDANYVVWTDTPVLDPHTGMVHVKWEDA